MDKEGAGEEHLCLSLGEAKAVGVTGPNDLPNTLFPPREGAKVASAREPEEHAALCGHLHPSDPHLCLLDHVSLRFLQSLHRLPLSNLVTAKHVLQSSRGPRYRGISSPPRHWRRASCWPSPSCLLVLCGTWVSRRTLCWLLP